MHRRLTEHLLQDNDILRCGCGNIDVVNTRPRTANDLQTAGSGGQNFRGYFGIRTNDGCVEILKCGVI